MLLLYFITSLAVSFVFDGCGLGGRSGRRSGGGMSVAAIGWGGICCGGRSVWSVVGISVVVVYAFSQPSFRSELFISADLRCELLTGCSLFVSGARLLLFSKGMRYVNSIFSVGHYDRFDQNCMLGRALFRRDVPSRTIYLPCRFRLLSVAKRQYFGLAGFSCAARDFSLFVRCRAVSSSSMNSFGPSIVSDQLHRSLAAPIPLKSICLSYFTRNPNTIDRNTKFKSKPKPKHSGNNLELVIDVDRIKQDLSSSLKSLKLRTRYEYRRFVNSGLDAYDDLRNMIVVDDGRRIMISCRRSTVMFVGNLVVWSFVACLGFRVLMEFIMWFRQGLGFGTGGGEYMVRRDRSLGGREVVVAQGTNKFKRNQSPKSLGIFQSPVFDGFLTEGVGLGTKKRVRKEEKLPGWFPVSVLQEPLTANVEEGQRMANGLVRAIMDAKINGRDVSEDDMIELRRICRTYRTKAHFDTANARDSFYRRSIDLVLNVCSRIRNHPSSDRIDGEDPRWFIAGLGDNLGIENTQAARMVTAAIAARTRSCLLQAWALELQQKHTEALAELTKICMLHQMFPPEESSPEMEMVARGLKKQLKLEHRQFLLNMLVEICGNETCTSMAEALGLSGQRGLEI
ncbi:unnamed protein product [Rhodiola kirilowii]